MRLLVDMMGAQTRGSRVRGIGRYTRELALALAKIDDPKLDLRFVLSANFPDAAREVLDLLSPHVEPSAFSYYATPATSQASSPQSDPARKIGEAIVRRHIASLRPNAFLATSLFEFEPDDFAYFNLARLPAPLTSAILYDLIPLRLPKQYLRYASQRQNFHEQATVLASADLLFAISEHSRRDAIELLKIDPSRIVTISGAADASFVRRDYHADEIAARLRRLGLREQFIFCAAGADPRKNAEGALDAYLQMSREDRRGTQFVLLAPLSEKTREHFASKATKAGMGDDVVFLARVDDADLAFLYSHAKLFLFPSLYEGFGLPVLEAMQCGAAIIAGDNSSIPEIADRADVRCDMTSPKTIAQALAHGLRDDGWRADVRRWGPERARHFSWASTATRLHDALLDRAPATSHARLRRPPPASLMLTEGFEAEIAGVLRKVKPPAATLATQQSLSAQAIAPLILRSAPKLYDGTARRLLIDVTTIVSADRRTGIQRVVRNIVRSLYLLREEDACVPVAVRLADGTLRSCEGFVSDLLACQNTVPDAEIVPGAGDCLLMLDNSWAAYARFAPVFDAIHRAGGKVVTCVYDLIPATQKPASIDPVPEIYDAWLRRALLASDGMITISRAVMHDLATFVAAKHPPLRPGLRVGWFHCGSDIADDLTRSTGEVRPALKAFLAASEPAFLVVGTLEPRKGHTIALDAFDLMWSAGVAAKLLVVGSRGWHIEALAARMRAAPTSRLLWLEDASDAELALAYAHCAALLNPSYAEGFGLPLSEAARENKPVICSDIPVFREIGGDGAIYFRVNDAVALSDTLHAFLAGRGAADPRKILQVTWEASARKIVDVVMHGAWSGLLETLQARQIETSSAKDVNSI